MREGSTLNADLLPDTGNMILQQPIVLPPRSEANAVFEIGLLVVITIGFDMFLDNIAVFAFLMMVSLRWIRMSAGLVICLIIHRNVPGLILTPIALVLVLYQSSLFTRHWIYFLTATLPPQRMRGVRSSLDPSLAWSLVFFPLTAARGTLALIPRGEEVWQAWVSYLNYGKGGIRVPGAFHSPAGTYSQRLQFFYVVGAAVTLAVGETPLPFMEMLGPGTILILACLCIVPALICVVIPALVLTVHLGRIRRASSL